MTTLWKQRIWAFWCAWGWPVLVAMLVATSFKSAIADWNIVPTGSMNPTIVEGDRILVNKLAYDLKIPYTTRHLASWEDPERGDIVVFFSPADGQRMVKRVIGLPGETIRMDNNRLWINGEQVHYAAESKEDHPFDTRDLEEILEGRPHSITIDPTLLSRHTFGPIVIPDGHYFMMGDNRDNSRDSRYFGCVERSLIVGRATAVVVSLDQNSWLRPRWSRFFSGL